MFEFPPGLELKLEKRSDKIQIIKIPTRVLQFFVFIAAPPYSPDDIFLRVVIVHGLFYKKCKNKSILKLIFLFMRRKRVGICACPPFSFYKVIFTITIGIFRPGTSL
jgi:hypothetical protein